MLSLCRVLYQDIYRETGIRLGAYSSLAVFLGKQTHRCCKLCFVGSGGLWLLQNIMPGKHRPGNLPEYTPRVNTSQSAPGKTLLVHAECMSPVMLPNLSKQVHTFLTTLPVPWQEKSPARYV